MIFRPLALAAFLLSADVASAHAQDPRLAQRLGAATADSVARLVTAAEAEGLPSAPLTAKALQGAARGAPPALVLRAVANLRDALRVARAALGPGRGVDELTAGAAALENGADTALLRRLALAAGTRPLTMSLVVMTDLLTRGVPGDTLATLLALAAHRGIPDDELLRMRESISRDIASGVQPLRAVDARLTPLFAAPPPPPPPGPPPPPPPPKKKTNKNQQK